MIGFSCPPLTVRPFKDAAGLILGNFQHWEIISEADHFLPAIESELAELLETSDLGISIHAPYSDINLAAFDELTRKGSLKVLTEIIAIMNRLDIGPLTIHPGVIGPIQHWDRARVPRLTRKSLEELADIAKEYSVKVALENMPTMRYCICQTMAEMAEMLEGLELGMCLDVGHANTSDQMDEMMLLKEKFINVHLHDNMGEKDQHLQLGQGNIDFQRVLGMLDGYDGNFIIEAKSPDIDDALHSKRVLEKLLI